MPHKISYSKFFVPPKFLEMPAVSVEISSAGIRFLCNRPTAEGLLPEKYGFIPLAPGDFFKGEILRSEAVVKALGEVRKRTGLSFVRFSLPEEKTYMFKTRLPLLSDKEIRDILDFKIEENVPLTAKEAVFDYDIIPNRQLGGLEVLVSVAPLKTVEDFQAVFETVGLTPILFSPESHNVAKSVIRHGNEQVIVVGNITENNIILSLVVSGLVYQTSSINFGSSTLTELISKYYSVSFGEAVKLKNDKLYLDSDESMEIFSYLINTISAIKDELGKFILYCNARADVLGKVDRVFLVGKDSLIVGLSKYLSANLHLPVEVANIWVNNFSLDTYLPDLSRADSLDYANVNGLNLF